MRLNIHILKLCYLEKRRFYFIKVIDKDKESDKNIKKKAILISYLKKEAKKKSDLYKKK